jgi:hypothetical protein
MSKSVKKAFLIISIALPFLIYCVYYYSMMIRNAPYKFSEFQSFAFQYGTDDSLINKYDSRTGDYQYLNNHDSLVKKRLHLRNDDFLYLHRKAAELGFWNFPQREINDSLKIKGIKSTHYFMQFNYKRKSKAVLFDDGFDGDPKLRDANIQMIKEIQKVLADEENREISLK